MRLALDHLEDAVRDSRYAARLLLRAPGFTLAAVACLAIGTGLATAMYAQVQSTVLADLPGVHDARSLVRLHKPVPFTTYEALRDDTDQFGSLAAYLGPVPLTLAVPGGGTHRVWGHLATPEYFEVLGVTAAGGRVFHIDQPVGRRKPGTGLPLMAYSGRAG